MNKQILYNAIRCPDGFVLESFHVHDFKTHTCAGREYMIDGGCFYVRRSANGDEEVLTEYLEEDNHEHNRKFFHWGTRGVKGDQPLSYVRLKDMDTDHIRNILNSQYQIIGTYVEDLLWNEIDYREL